MQNKNMVIDYSIVKDYVACRLMSGELRLVDISDLDDYYGSDYLTVLDRLPFLDNCVMLSHYLVWLESQTKPLLEFEKIPDWAIVISIALVVSTIFIVILTAC
jgi:hypothetical protein